MEINEILTEDRTFCRIEASSKKRAIEAASELVAQTRPELSAAGIYSALMSREKISPTALGEGIALPHCRVPCRQIIGALVTLAEPIDYGAIDDEPINTLFVLLVPEEENEEHLKTIAGLVARFEHKQYRDALIRADTSADLFEAALNSDFGTGVSAQQTR